MNFFNNLNFSEDRNVKRKVNTELEDMGLWKKNNYKVDEYSSLPITQSVNGWFLIYFFDEEININNPERAVSSNPLCKWMNPTDIL